MSHIKEAAKLNQLKYVFSEEVNKATISELRAIGIGNFVDGANWSIDKACEWLIEHKEAVETEDNGIMGWIPDYFIEDFRRAMED